MPDLDMDRWLAGYQAMALDLFGGRVRFIGLQGSRARGEAGPDSDIDVVLVLDRLEPADLTAYRRGLDGLPRRELVCGFFSGAEELRRWDRGDRFQFWYDTAPVLGRLEDLFPAPGREDAALWHALREEDPGRCTAQLLRWCSGAIRTFG